MLFATPILILTLLARVGLAQAVDSSMGSILTGSSAGSVVAGVDPSLILPANASLPEPMDLRSANFPSRVLAPYAEIGSNGDDIVSYAKKYGLKYFTLAFILDDGSRSGNPCWAGDRSMGLSSYASQVSAFRAMGGDVIISFGGADGKEIASVNTLENTVKAYMKVVQYYRARWIDFDVEGSRANDRASIDLRNKAIAQVQAAVGWPLRVSYTLATGVGGLDDSGIYILQSAMKYGAKVSVVNIMTMDFGTSDAPNGATGMGTYAIAAAVATNKQLQQIGLKASVGITPMIGVNDSTDEHFRLIDAANVASWAKGCGYVASIGFWDINRDNGNKDSLSESSMLSQADGAFGSALLAFE
ncbi:hypothetical protein HK101_010530 [Irineochytrium annulatum]|nr:hypothetical protein HK101_010530 [Irineochytrium annulatum]